MRDLIGYGDTPIAAAWPGEARVAVSFVVNFEEGAEYAIADGDARNEGIYEAVHQLDGVPDYCILSHFDYGTRAGWWRIMNLLDEYDIKCTVDACGQAVSRAPTLAQDALRRGHELSAHGWRWESHAGMDEQTEREAIRKTVDVFESVIGRPPAGWHTRSSSSPNTRRLLMESGSFIYDSDFYGDDLPVLIRRPDGGPHVLLPYAFDTNDMQFLHTQRFSLADNFATYVKDAFDWLYREGETQPKMMTIGLHLRIVGRPARMWALKNIVEHILAHERVWIATRESIARHWRLTHIA